MSKLELNLQTIKEKMVFVHASMSVYSGEVSLSKTNLASSGLPKNLVTTGGLKLVDPKAFNSIDSIKAGLRSKLAKFGQSCDFGFATPREKWEFAKSSILEAQPKFDFAVDEFCNNYKILNEQWAIRDDHKGFSDAIVNAAHSIEYVRSRFAFRYSAVTCDPFAGTEDQFVEEIHGLIPSIHQDISQKAKSALKGYRSNKSAITARIGNTMNEICEKLSCLAFLDSNLQHTSDVIQNFMNAQLQHVIPGKKQLPEDVQSKIATLLMQMENPENLPVLGDLIDSIHKPVEIVSIPSDSAADSIDALQPNPTQQSPWSGFTKQTFF